MTAACLGSGRFFGARNIRPVIPKWPSSGIFLPDLLACNVNKSYFPRRDKSANFAPSKVCRNFFSEVSRRTFSRRTSTPRMVFPHSNGRKCLARISTSGSSGMNDCSGVSAERRKNKFRLSAESRYETSVPTFSPMTTRRRLCGLLKSKTMIGILLSMHSENAVESITFNCFCNAAR